MHHDQIDVRTFHVEGSRLFFSSLAIDEQYDRLVKHYESITCQVGLFLVTVGFVCFGFEMFD